jgi:uncharacterized repeat protein (TIGR03809 family)
MTHRADVARGRDTVARWCALAEQRLEHLTELFESGRWRRYHSELAFLQNIHEARASVEIWRDLLSRAAARDNAAVDLSRLDRSIATLPRGHSFGDQVDRLAPQPAIPEQPAPSALSDALMAAESDHVGSEDAPSAPVLDVRLKIATITERYPLLRNTLYGQ